MGMLICFGFAWPISLVKSYKSKSTGGKSPWFSVIVVVGYIFGVIHKLLYSRDIVMVLYIINAVMVITDLCLWIRNRRIERRTNIDKSWEEK